MDVKDIMIKPITLDHAQPVRRAIATLKEKKLRELLITDGEKLKGMVTTLWLAQSGIKPETKVGNTMFNPPTVKPTHTLDQVVRLMIDNAVETVPVIDGVKLVGAVTSDQILKNVKFQGKVMDTMISGVITIQINEPISKAKRLMWLHDINRLPVLKGNKLVGIITSSDLLRNLRLREGYHKRADLMGDVIKYFDAPVEGIMTPQVTTVKPDEDLAFAANKMIELDVRALPVVADDNRLVGIICRKDIIRTLYPYVGGVMVAFSGLKGVSDWEVMQLRRLTSDWIRRIAHYVDLNQVEVNVKKEHAGTLFRVDIKANMEMKSLTRSGKQRKGVKSETLPISHTEGYGLIPTATEAFQKLEKKLRNSRTTFP